MGSVFVLLALVVCGVAGWLFGARSARVQRSTGGAHPSALARAWQEGYDAGRIVEGPLSLPAPEATLSVESTAAQAPPKQDHPREDPPAVLAEEDDIRSVVSRALE